MPEQLRGHVDAPGRRLRRVSGVEALRPWRGWRRRGQAGAASALIDLWNRLPGRTSRTHAGMSMHEHASSRRGHGVAACPHCDPVEQRWGALIYRLICRLVEIDDGTDLHGETGGALSGR
jgi:hypothetical protein